MYHRSVWPDPANMGGLTTLKTIGTISAISSTCQGLAWSAISLPAILCYVCAIKPDPISKNTQLTYVHYLAAYFQGSCDADLKLYKNVPEVTSSGSLLILTIFFYAFNLLLGVFAIIVLVAISTNRRRLIRGWLLCYVTIGFCVSIMDIITSGFVASDYDHISTSPLVPNREVAGFAILSILLITSRGIILWLGNTLFFLYIAISLCKESFDEKETTRPGTALTDDTAASFQFDRNDMEKPIEYVQRSQEKRGHEYPEHCAYSRWPKLHPGNRLAVKPEPKSPQYPKPQPPKIPYNVPQQYQQPYQMPKQAYTQAYSHQQRPQQSPRYEQEVPKQRPASLYPDKQLAQYRQQQNHYGKPSNDSRPGSLQEAIMTMRPLRQVRPNISQMAESYP